ncbi:hypothetical protein JHK82_048115 [Glycine max]|nr:hypothetical protein JHK82_048115 [Glycine max]
MMNKDTPGYSGRRGSKNLGELVSGDYPTFGADMTVKVYEDGGYFIDDEDLTPSEIAFYQGVYGEEISREHVASSDRELDSLGDESDHFEEMTLP